MEEKKILETKGFTQESPNANELTDENLDQIAGGLPNDGHGGRVSQAEIDRTYTRRYIENEKHGYYEAFIVCLNDSSDAQFNSFGYTRDRVNHCVSYSQRIQRNSVDNGHRPLL